MSIESKYAQQKAQGLLKEYGPFIQQTIDEITKEFDAPINLQTAEEVGLEYSRRQAGRNALKLLMQKLNSKANERN